MTAVGKKMEMHPEHLSLQGAGGRQDPCVYTAGDQYVQVTCVLRGKREGYHPQRDKEQSADGDRSIKSVPGFHTLLDRLFAADWMDGVCRNSWNILQP